MKTYQTKNIRNVVLIGGSRSGKTTLSEAMLFEGKVIDRRGSVEDKNTVSDNTEFEQTNQKSINATPLYAEFGGCKINVIDAPGSDDFSGGALSAFKVVESAVMVMNGTAGVEVGTTIFARYADKYGIPMIIAVNQMDHEKANWDLVRTAIGEEFGKKAVICQFPVNPGPGLEGFVDVITMKFYNTKNEELEIPAAYADEAEELRAELMEKAATSSPRHNFTPGAPRWGRMTMCPSILKRTSTASQIHGPTGRWSSTASSTARATGFTTLLWKVPRSHASSTPTPAP